MHVRAGFQNFPTLVLGPHHERVHRSFDMWLVLTLPLLLSHHFSWTERRRVRCQRQDRPTARLTLPLVRSESDFVSITWRSRNKSVTSASWLAKRLLTFFRYVFRYLVTRLPPHCNYRISQHVIIRDGRSWETIIETIRNGTRSVLWFISSSRSEWNSECTNSISPREPQLKILDAVRSDRRRCISRQYTIFDRDREGREGRASVLTVWRGQIILFVLRSLLSRARVLDRSLSLRRRRHRAGTRRYPVNAVHREVFLDGGDRGGRDRASGSSRFVFRHHLAHCNDKLKRAR